MNFKRTESGTSAAALRCARLVAAAGLAVVIVACWVHYTAPRPVDFVSFWAAAQMLGPSAYDIAAHRAVEATAVPISGLMPFVYPPPFLFFVAPFGLVGYPAALVAWVAITGGLYLIAAREFGWLAHPCAIANALIGQVGFLTAAMFVGGFRLLASRPLLAGAILGCMVIKPQLAVLLPVALVAGRERRAIAGAALSSVGLILFSLAVFGPDTLFAFGASLPSFAGHLGDGAWKWSELASVFSVARGLGVPDPAALLIHALVASAAAVMVWVSWRDNRPEKIASLAAATVLIPPYIFSYDYLLLMVPLAALWHRPVAAIVIWGLSALPLAAFFGLYDGPNTLPLAALLSLALLKYAGREASVAAAHEMLVAVSQPTQATKSKPPLTPA